MDYTKPHFWIAIGTGGALIAILSAVQQLYTKDQYASFRPQPVVRDFCFGAFLTAILYMFLPESVTSLVSAGQGLVASSLPMKAQEVIKGTSDYELQVGPAKF